jgi:hypothetical protein
MLTSVSIAFMVFVLHVNSELRVHALFCGRFSQKKEEGALVFSHSKESQAFYDSLVKERQFLFLLPFGWLDRFRQ